MAPRAQPAVRRHELGQTQKAIGFSILEHARRGLVVADQVPPSPPVGQLYVPTTLFVCAL